MDEDRLKVEESLEGNPEALIFLQNKHHPFLVSMLVAKGANRTEAEDLLADLWGDCVGGADDRSSILTKYSGRRPLRNWLATVAIHRLFDWKRRQKFCGAPAWKCREGAAVGELVEVVGGDLRLQDEILIGRLRECLEEAFSTCPPHALLMLRLVFMHDLSQREVGRMWGWHESRVSRALNRTLREIESQTIRRIRNLDPWFELAWEDFLELCETHQMGFL